MAPSYITFLVYFTQERYFLRQSDRLNATWKRVHVPVPYSGGCGGGVAQIKEAKKKKTTTEFGLLTERATAAAERKKTK